MDLSAESFSWRILIWLEREPKEIGSVKIGVLIKADDDWLEEVENVEEVATEKEKIKTFF